MRNHAKIIEPNDQLRTAFKGGRVQMPASVYDLDEERLRGRALAVMTRYDKFDKDSDHDTGVFIFAGYSFEWHIEYRGEDGLGTSPDPADPEKIFRVLTLYAVNDVLNGVGHGDSWVSVPPMSKCLGTAVAKTHHLRERAFELQNHLSKMWRAARQAVQ